MTSKEFVIWLKGFIAGSNNYNLTPQGWEALKNNLEKVNDNLNIKQDEGTTNDMP
jgi:DNA-binding PadR family transcriptional regulator